MNDYYHGFGNATAKLQFHRTPPTQTQSGAWNHLFYWEWQGARREFIINGPTEYLCQDEENKLLIAETHKALELLISDLIARR